MTEDDLRATFARHETLTPPTGPLRTAIDRIAARRRRRRRRFTAVGTSLALLVAVVVGAPRYAADPARSVDGPASRAELLGQPGGPLNVLLLGVDGTSVTVGDPPRADSILLVHIPADQRRIYLISLPRDLAVPIPGHGVDKLGASFPRGVGDREPSLGRGYQLTSRTVTELTGVRPDAGAVLTYPAVQAITDAVAGVPVCLREPVRSVHTQRIFPAGCQRLDGAAAVDLLRQRHGLAEDARDRDRNAQRYAVGLLRRLTEQRLLTDPVGLHRLMQTAGAGLTVDAGHAELPDLLALRATVTPTEPVGVLLPTVAAGDAPGTRHLDEGDGRALLAALRDDRVADWVAANPEHVLSQG
ncbi:LCP family protein [Micromonospora cathayae]|uniref:LCP family protein n=1 Tax=Micromonospora cathayae TaxID=3028804 RepID=A0ABY7ZUH6_9ACTN|nr:LCP family protein [Micromonospora sp. HUAS 3]WDZ86148.1 LCP family protein [Micromonospora sp. HUAS 3]